MELPQSPNDQAAYGLIIGIGQYQDSGIRSLRYTHADAQAFFDLLTDRRRCGIPPENIKLLLDQDATLFSIKHAISGWLYERAVPDSKVIIFFAGHGGVETDRRSAEPDGLAKYLLPWDARRDNLYASALSNNEFHDLLHTVKARRLVIFMDACYAGGVARRGARDIGIAGNPYDRLVEGHGRLVIAAARPNQRSWEDESLGHGIFTHHLLEALGGKADNDEDGYVSVTEVYKYLERNVPLTARRLARGEQEPLMCGDLSRDIILTVDMERKAKAQRKRQEEAHLRKEELRRKRHALFQLHDAGKLPTDAFNEAILLLEQKSEERSHIDRRLAQYLDAMLTDAISSTLYLETRSIMRMAPKPEPSRANVRGQEAKEVEPATPRKRFCTNCGKQATPNNRFCTGCGRQLTT